MECLVPAPTEEFVTSCGRTAVAVLYCGCSLAPRLGDGEPCPGQYNRSEVGEVDAEATPI